MGTTAFYDTIIDATPEQQALALSWYQAQSATSA